MLVNRMISPASARRLTKDHLLPRAVAAAPPPLRRSIVRHLDKVRAEIRLTALAVFDLCRQRASWPMRSLVIETWKVLCRFCSSQPYRH
jgi:hypothetical protein